MAGMRRIEGTAQEADPLAGLRQAPAEAFRQARRRGRPMRLPAPARPEKSMTQDGQDSYGTARA